MTREEKEAFRKTSRWKHWRTKIKGLFHNMDMITLRPLTKTWNLHHLDMRDANYTKLDDPKRFLPLNKDTHDFVHWLWRLYKKDKKVLDRLRTVMQKMEEYNAD